MSGSAVSYRNLTKRYGTKTAVNDVSLEIPAGSFFGICGPNGAGKTTLLRMTCGLLRPDSGTVEVAGHDVWADPVGAKTRLGMVPDNPSMFTRLGGRELIEFNGLLRGMDPSVVSERADSLLRLLDLEEAADTLIADYSLGMTKKVAIACALLHSPRVVFLDEPFAGIDPVARQVLETILRSFTRGRGDGGLLRPHDGRSRAIVRPSHDHRRRKHPDRGPHCRDHGWSPSPGCLRRVGRRRRNRRSGSGMVGLFFRLKLRLTRNRLRRSGTWGVVGFIMIWLGAAVMGSLLGVARLRGRLSVGRRRTCAGPFNGGTRLAGDTGRGGGA